MLLKRMDLWFTPVQENLRQHATDMGRSQTKGRLQQGWPGNTHLRSSPICSKQNQLR